MSKVIFYKEVDEAFKARGFTLVSKEYISAKTKLDYRCANGHLYNITWSNFKTGYGCPFCYGNTKPSIEEVKEVFEKKGYTLVSSVYVNAHAKLKTICPSGHVYYTTFDSFKKGNGCSICWSIRIVGENHPNWKGGISFEPYCEAWKDKEYKKDIRNRDGNRCLNPYCDSSNKDDLTIHHIDYNKKNCKPSNLITICRSCNSKANKDRRWHKAWYQAIINKRNY